MFNVLICGGRDFGGPRQQDNLRREVQEGYMDDILKQLVETREVTMAVHGNADGADKYCGMALLNQYNIPTLAVPALWEAEGKSAGFKRNQKMLDLVDVNLVLAFPGGRGTAMMMDLARRAGVEKVTDLDDHYTEYFLNYG